MTEENEIEVLKYDELLISIIAYTRGRWCVDDVVAMYEFILDEIELQKKPEHKPDLKVIEMKRDDHDGSGD
jgi:hypothetical protein